MSAKDGGPAFPRIDVEHIPAGYGHGEHCATEQRPGMSLRDYFAASALAGLLGSEGATPLSMGRKSVAAQNHRTIESQIALESYALADAMLAERVR